MNVEDMREFISTMMWKLHSLPYRWGGDDTIEGFDCSGGALEIYRSLGILPGKGDMNAQGIHAFLGRNGKTLDATASFMLCGDAIFFGTSTMDITHIGIALNDDIMFEFGGGGSKTTSADAAAKQNAYGRFRPILNRRDLVAVIRPSQLAP